MRWDCARISRCAVSCLNMMRRRGRHNLKGELTMSDFKPRYTGIEKEINAQIGTVILENPSGHPRTEPNLYCVGQDGKVIWVAQVPEAGALYTRVKFDDEAKSC